MREVTFNFMADVKYSFPSHTHVLRTEKPLHSPNQWDDTSAIGSRRASTPNTQKAQKEEVCTHSLTTSAAASSPQEHLSAWRSLVKKRSQRSAVLMPLMQPVIPLPHPVNRARTRGPAYLRLKRVSLAGVTSASTASMLVLTYSEQHLP